MKLKLWGSCDKLEIFSILKFVANIISIILKGFSHLFFQESALLGFLIVVSLGIVSPVTLLLSVIGNVSGLLTALILGVKKPIVELGIYGFNGVLIGSLVSFYIKQLPLALVITAIASAVAAVLFYILFKNNIIPLAAPFLFVGWVIILLLKFLK